MKVHLFVFCCMICSPIGMLAQEKAHADRKVAQAVLATACGDMSESMAVELSHEHEVAPKPEPDKAKVYFIQDTGIGLTWGYPTTKIGIDGKWVGANKKDSYFSVTVDPGAHHLCVAIQSSFLRGDVELAHLNAEAGKVYYYRSRIDDSNSGPQYLSFTHLDSDEGRYLVALNRRATAHVRK